MGHWNTPIRRGATSAAAYPILQKLPTRFRHSMGWYQWVSRIAPVEIPFMDTTLNPMGNIWPYRFFLYPPSKNGCPFDCSIFITAIGMIASKKSCAASNSPIAIVVSNFHIYGGAWPHEISRYHPPGHANRRNSDSKYAKCGEQLVWTLFNTIVKMLYDHIMVCFEKWH